MALWVETNQDPGCRGSATCEPETFMAGGRGLSRADSILNPGLGSGVGNPVVEVEAATGGCHPR